MTGKGYNDAQALRKADVGFAMGYTGTAIAKEASSWVLQKDDFSALIPAILIGRNIYWNIRKFIQF